MAGKDKPPARREDEIMRDLRAEREQFVTALGGLGESMQTAAEDVRRRAGELARRVVPAAVAAVALLLVALLVRRRRRNAHR